MIWNSINNRLKNIASKHHDFRINRHIVVFESDDWGSIRMSNKKAWDELLRKGYAVDKRPYERFDTLEMAEDLEALFDVLSKYKDCKGNHPIITANMLMANPDFERIKESGYHEYYYEPIATTYERYFGNTKVLELMRQGYECGVFMPQSHGREHFNVIGWLNGLREGNEDLLTAFKHGMCGVAPKGHPELGNQMMKALYAETEDGQRGIDETVTEGLRMFERMWGFKSNTFVAPCFCWSEQTEKVLSDNGVELIQTARVNREAYQTSVKFYYTGQRNKYNQLYSIRNCSFEPATNPEDNSIASLIRQIKKSFSNNKIAIISTHRINYVSGIDVKNRSNNLALLDELLKTILEKYHDVEFLSSNEIIKIIS